MMRAKPIQTTKWGTACAQCAAAKAKCSGRSGTPGSKCDRCERLLKHCTDQVHKQRKTRQARQPQSQQTDTGSPSFEGAFDSMASTPEYPSSPSAAELGMETSSVGSHRSGPRDRPSLLRASSSHSQHNVERYLSSVPEAYSSNAFYASQSPLSRAREMAIFDGREDADQVLLCKYRNDLMPRHPFVIVPDHLPASTLKVHHPFVMLVIRVITSFDDLRTIHARMHRLTGLIADRMFRHAERSLDLLMGIVMLLGWHHYNCPKHSQLNNLLCLAESLVSDLGLNRRPLVREDGQEEGGTIQEKRLLLGVWYLRSSAAMHLQQLTSMPFTSYMRQCLVEVQEEKEHELDPVLVHFVKIQYLAERVAVLKTPQQRNTTEVGSDRMAVDSNELDKEGQERAAALAGCQVYLDRLARELPHGLKEDAMITMQFNTVALRLSESRGSDVPCTRDFTASSTARLAFSPDSPTIETLLQTASAPIRTWFNSWISGVPASAYSALPSHAVLQLLYALRAVVLGHERFAPKAASVSGASASTSTSQSAWSGVEGIATILNRLIALGPGRPDLDKFWAALGERYEDECAHGATASGADDISEAGEDAPSPIMSGPYQVGPATTHTSGMLHHPIPSSIPILGGHYPTLETQANQTLYHSNMFIPPSRVPSVSPGQGEYSGLSLLPSSSMSALQPGQQLPHSQWATAGQWEAGPSSWAASSGIPEGVDPEMWLRETGQGNQQYDWGADPR